MMIAFFITMTPYQIIDRREKKANGDKQPCCYTQVYSLILEAVIGEILCTSNETLMPKIITLLARTAGGKKVSSINTKRI